MSFEEAAKLRPETPTEMWKIVKQTSPKDAISVKPTSNRKGWKTIRLFVSSTFKDFHQEREVLVKEVRTFVNIFNKENQKQPLTAAIILAAQKKFKIHPKTFVTGVLFNKLVGVQFCPKSARLRHCTKKWSFLLRICHLRIKFPADLVTFIEEILNGKFHFLCSTDSFLGLFLGFYRITIFQNTSERRFQENPYQVICGDYL